MHIHVYQGSGLKEPCTIHVECMHVECMHVCMTACTCTMYACTMYACMHVHVQLTLIVLSYPVKSSVSSLCAVYLMSCLML